MCRIMKFACVLFWAVLFQATCSDAIAFRYCYHQNIFHLFLHKKCNACRPDRLAQAIPQWQATGSGYIGVMRAGTDAHDMPTSPWYDPLGVLFNNKYYMYASGGMYALSSDAVQIITQVPLSQRRLSGGGEDASLGLWVLGYDIKYLDDRRLGVIYDNGPCPQNFIGKALYACKALSM